MLATLLQFFCGALSAAAPLYQRKYNKLHRSIYGLSYDLYVLDLVSCLLSIYTTVNYLWSPLARSQLANRFPLFYPINESLGIPISMSLLMKDFFNLVTCALVLQQLLMYRSTKSIYQGISTTCTLLLMIVSAFGVFTYACSCYNLPVSDSGRFGVYFIEHVNYMWVVGNIIQSLKYVPQLSLNWMGLCTRGISSRFILLSLLAESVTGLGSVILPQTTDFYKKPYNFTPKFVNVIKTMCLLGILYQAQCLYVGRKAYLPKGK